MAERSILVIDDDPRYLELLEYLLQGEGYTVYTAQAAADGQQIAREKLPGVIVTDVSMPEIDGYMLTAGLKSDPRTAGIPVILVTARGHNDDLHEGFAAGASGILTKPFAIEELIAKISRVWESGGLKEALR